MCSGFSSSHEQCYLRAVLCPRLFSVCTTTRHRAPPSLACWRSVLLVFAAGRRSRAVIVVFRHFRPFAFARKRRFTPERSRFTL